MSQRIFLRLLLLCYLSLLASCATQKTKDELPTYSKTIPSISIPPKHPFQSYPEHPLTGIYAHSPAVKNFIQHMSKQHGFDENYLNSLFSDAHRLQYVVRLENAPLYQGPKDAKPKLGSWTRYRKQFLDQAHINNGVQFWSDNADAIQRASTRYGVDPEYIVAIIGVETFYGRNVGSTCTFDALTTLAFDTQRRSTFFQQELENFLLMAREEGYNPVEPVGSWAGAMGLGQFMPSSFRRLAVDFNQDGKRNLWQPQDAIGSVAHYFAKHGWQVQQPVAEQTADDEPDTIILGASHGHEHWRVHPNFAVIKKYNNSNKYAMAVHQLAQAIKQHL